MSLISLRAQEHMKTAPLLISPMVVLEMQYLFEIGKTLRPARDLQMKLEQDFRIHVCGLDFAAVATAALDESWTRDAFDRVIVANAKANNFAYLVTSDRKIRLNYPRAIW